MTTLLESGARPYHTRRGIVISMLLHGGLIAAAVAGTARVMLPPREKVEEHPILYVAAPPPKPLEVKSEPLPPAPKAKVHTAPQPVAPRRVQAPRPVAPTPQPKAPVLAAPTKIAVSIPAVDLKAMPTVDDVVASARPAVDDAALGRGLSNDDAAGGRRSGSGGLGSGSAGKAFDENEVDRAVEVTRGNAPRYPDALRSVGVEGQVVVHFIVGTDGRVEPGSIEAVSSPNKLFTAAVRTALLETRYRPAEAGGRAVRQLVEQAFAFRLAK